MSAAVKSTKLIVYGDILILISYKDILHFWELLSTTQENMVV